VVATEGRDVGPSAWVVERVEEAGDGRERGVLPRQYHVEILLEPGDEAAGEEVERALGVREEEGAAGVDMAATHPLREQAQERRTAGDERGALDVTRIHEGHATAVDGTWRPDSVARSACRDRPTRAASAAWDSPARWRWARSLVDVRGSGTRSSWRAGAP
jgi:hypothetical protein